jgi:hypothetical protein
LKARAVQQCGLAFPPAGIADFRFTIEEKSGLGQA